MRWRAVLDPSRLARVSALAMLVAPWADARAAAPAEAEGSAATKPAAQGRPKMTAARRVLRAKYDPDAPVPAEAAPAPVELPESARPVAPAPEAAAPKVEVTETEIHTNPPVTPGARLGLEAGRKLDGMRFHWVQVEGPPVEIADPSRPSIQVTIPAGTARLGFILVAARSDLVRLVRLSVPVQGAAAGSAPSSWGTRASGKVKADAGDDQVGLVGHRVTLNGTRSVPGDGKTARWVQVGGPAVIAPEQQGAFFSFVPTGAGTYRFLLVVAGEGEVSEPDEVAVLVGTPPAGGVSAAAAMAVAPAAPAVPATPPGPPTPDQVLAATLPRLPNATRIGSEVADVLEAVSERATLYTSFSVLQDELVRRLDVVLPADPAQRTAWARDVFYPLTTYTAGRLAAAGLDLYHPQGFQQPLTPAQQDQLRDHFLQLARSFRASVASR